MKQVLFVCQGNVCRSPLAEAVMRKLLTDRGLLGEIGLDSAGTDTWCVGEPAEQRVRLEALRRGYRIDCRARALCKQDLERFDLVVVMDRSNLDDVRMLDRKGDFGRKVALLGHYCRRRTLDDVPDPYRGGGAGFDRVVEIVEDGCTGLLEALRTEAGGVAVA